MLLGNRAIESTVGDNLAGTLEAFAFRARRGGTATSISVYLDKRDRATTVYVGLYSSRHGHPHSLMTSGSRRSPKAGVWNSLAVGSSHLQSGATYWLAILGKGGAIYFRDRNGRSCAGNQSSMRNMPSLPRTWPAGLNSHGCLISAFVKGIGRVSSGTGGGTLAFGTNAPAEPTTPGNGTNASTPSSTPPATPGPVLTLPPVVTAAPTIIGSPVVGQTLTTSNGSWIDSPTSYAYQWQDCDALGILCTNIAGAASSSYVPGITDVGQTIRAVVTASNAGGSGSAASTQTATVSVPPPPSNTGLPVVSGTAQQGSTLSTSNGSWTGSPTSYAYQWQRCSSSCSSISGATSSSYTLQATDVGDTIDVIVTATNTGGSTPATSAKTATVSLPTPPSNTGVPVVSGTAQQGSTLSTSNGSWTGSPTSYAYQWQDCNSAGASCANISGAVSSSYVLASRDVGSTVRAVVDACNTTTNCGYADSAASNMVVASGGSGGSAPTNGSVPAVVDSTLLNNYEAADVVQASVGSWNNCSGGSACTYIYQFQRCTGISGTAGTGCSNIGAPQCSATAATTCSYTLASGDVGDYIVASVTASNGSGNSSPAASQALGAVVASRINQPCTNTTALTNLLTGPHLCGWPDTTNVGYANAPGYPGSLTVASSGSSTCPTTPQSNHTYSFCQWNGLSLPANLTNVTFYGDGFLRTAPQNANVAGGSGDNNITFDYDTFAPPITYPGEGACTSASNCSLVTCSQSYQYGIYNENGAMKGYTVENSWFWGFGNAIDTSGSTQASPQIFKYNFFSDAVTDSSCGYHTDGIGMLNTATESYATVDHNAFSFIGNTNEIAWQNGSYDHITNTNNFMDGDNAMYAGARCTSGCTAATFIATTGNTFDAFLEHGAGDYPTDLAGGYATATGSTWNHNYWMVPPGSSSTSAAGTSPSAPGTHNGEFVIPNDHSNGFPNDCGWVSHTDYPNTTTDC